MIFGCGIDFISVSRIRDAIQNNDKFINKIYTDKEILYSEKHGKNKFAKFATRFAAKEAFLKALGTGYKDGISFKEIEIIRKDLSAPQITLHGKTKDIFEKICGNANIFVSLSDDSEFAIANVIIEKV